VQEAVKALVDRFGQIDILINNAGTGVQGSIADNDDTEWFKVLTMLESLRSLVQLKSFEWDRIERERLRCGNIEVIRCPIIVRIELNDKRAGFECDGWLHP
jgi:short chain dehydrogenase